MLIQSAVIVGVPSLPSQHFKYSGEVGLRCGKKVIILNDPSWLNLQNSLGNLREWHLAPAAFLRASASSDRAALFHKHSRGELASWIVIGRPTNAHVFVVHAPTI